MMEDTTPQHLIAKAKEILLANPRGFCAGVDRAIDIVNAALVKFGAPVYVRHEWRAIASDNPRRMGS